MEFDNHIKLQETGRCRFRTALDDETLEKKLWDHFLAAAAHVGQMDAAEYWLDCPAPLRTRHLVVNVDRDETDPACRILRFRGGSKPDYLCDVLVMFLVLAAFWCLSKLLVPAPPVGFIAGGIAAAVAAVGLFVWSGKTFGRKETAQLTRTILLDKSIVAEETLPEIEKA